MAGVPPIFKNKFPSLSNAHLPIFSDLPLSGKKIKLEWYDGLPTPLISTQYALDTCVILNSYQLILLITEA